ncbi:MAG: hypothetical protein EHM35_05535 [Planctomycetaceae bacterium]|nr:MAG: hypothetical protein EHM35_05535 [Planctomycetaceae bacterium]
MSKKIIVTDPGCHACADAKKKLKPYLDSGELVEVPVESPEGRVIDQQLDVEYVPECVVKDENGRYKRCPKGTLESMAKKRGHDLDLDFEL